MGEAIEWREFDSADAFLAYLRLSSEHWLKGGLRAWIFRGQMDSDWRLIPSACRSENSRIPVLDELSLALIDREMARAQQDQWLPLQRVDGEIALKLVREVVAQILELQAFVGLCDDLGLPIPDVGILERRPEEIVANVIKDSLEGRSPMEELSQAMALAQHHGIPTRLLDWTRNPVFAAFFAAEDAWRNLSGHLAPDKIVVWALNTELLRQQGSGEELRMVTVPRHQHSFLHAQDGLFLWAPNSPAGFIKTGAWRPFDELISVQFELFCRGATRNIPRFKPENSRCLKRLMLPMGEVGRLLMLLDRERVSRAHLMPTYDNVRAALAIRSRLSQLPITGRQKNGQAG